MIIRVWRIAISGSILLIIGFLVWWLLIPHSAKTSLQRFAIAQLLVRPNICMHSNWNREALRPGHFRVADTRDWNNNVLILYDAWCSSLGSGQMQPVIGYELFQPTSQGWSSLGGGSSGGQSLSTMVAYHFGFHKGTAQTGQAFDYSLVQGRVLDARVHRLEAIFADGTIVSETPARDTFALVYGQASIACTLRVIDVQGHILESIVLWQGPAPSQLTGTC